MNVDALLESVGSFFQSNLGIAVLWAALVGLFIFLASRFNPMQDTWKQYEGSIITGIKLAEKQIPDGTPDGGLAKLNRALQFVLEAYAEANRGKQPPADLVHELKEGIQIKHSELDRFGGLTKSKGAT